MTRIGTKLVQQKKSALQRDDGDLKSKDVVDRDLLSVLVKANMSTDIDDSERLTDEEMMGQITTFILAGHETSAMSTVWLLYELAKPQNLPIQERLRAELLTSSSTEPSMEELNALPYLDAVMRENMRTNSVATVARREADKDDIIPLSIPIVDHNGITRHEIEVTKGQGIFVSTLAMNRDRSIWGEDAFEFRPERWLAPNSHPRSFEIPGVYSGVMSFLGGPRHCIGYRFALLEMKVLVYSLVRSFHFGLPDPAPLIEKRSGIIIHPVIKDSGDKAKRCMPLSLKAINGA